MYIIFDCISLFICILIVNLKLCVHSVKIGEKLWMCVVVMDIITTKI